MDQLYLERCGSRLHRLIDPTIWPVVGNSHVIAWKARNRGLEGLFLPSLRQFVATGFPITESTYEMTAHHLWILRGYDLYEASSPTPPATGKGKNRNWVAALGQLTAA